MRAWLQVRQLARSFGVAGDHAGQQSNGYRCTGQHATWTCAANKVWF